MPSYEPPTLRQTDHVRAPKDVPVIARNLGATETSILHAPLLADFPHVFGVNTPGVLAIQASAACQALNREASMAGRSFHLSRS